MRARGSGGRGDFYTDGEMLYTTIVMMQGLNVVLGSTDECLPWREHATDIFLPVDVVLVGSEVG